VILGFLIFAKLLLYGLACFRLSLLISDDVGPFGVFSKLRSFLKREAKESKAIRASKVHIGISCIRCDSIWFAFPLAAYAMFRHRLLDWIVVGGDIFVFAMALSAIAILFVRAFPENS